MKITFEETLEEIDHRIGDTNTYKITDIIRALCGEIDRLTEENKMLWGKGI